jgi:MFS family permease
MDKAVVEVSIIIASVLSGAGEALIWIGQGNYISLCATDSTQGFYFGYNWAIYMTSQVIGNLFGALMIEKLDGAMFFLYNWLMMLLAAVLFCLVVTPPEPVLPRL